MKMPQRTDGIPAQDTGRDFDRGRALEKMPTDRLPQLPRGQKPRSELEPIPEGFTKEEADRSERMELALNTMSTNCQTYWPSDILVCGAIRYKYNAMGAQFSWLSLPNSPEYVNPDGTGRRQQFLNGSIYWHPTTGAHPVTILYMTKWNQLGWETGWLGYPTAD